MEALRNVPEDATQLRLCLNTPLMGVTVEEAGGSGTKEYITGEGADPQDEFKDVFLDYIMPIRMNK